MQSTETGAIFAGTGSEIRMRSSKKKKITPPQNGASCHPPADSDVIALGNRGKLDTQSPLGKRDTSGKTNTDNSSSKIFKEERKKLKIKNKKKKRRKSVEIDGGKVENVEKIEAYKKEDENEDEEDEGDKEKQNGKSKTSEDDVLMSLFRSSGIHSALKHDKIEQSGNPDYVLVEKEAERVAKQAITALRQSRTKCRANGYSVPTWTGRTDESSSSQAALNRKRFGRQTNKEGASDPVARKRFGRQSKDDETNPTEPKIKKEKPECPNNGFDLDSESIDVSSSSLLARMRSRNAVVNNAGSTSSENVPQTAEGRLLKDIELFVKSRPDNTASSNELTDQFKDDLKPGQNALFKELLKQLCILRKENGTGYWKLKKEFL